MLSDPVALHGECGASDVHADLRFPGRKTFSIGAVAVDITLGGENLGACVKATDKSQRVDEEGKGIHARRLLYELGGDLRCLMRRQSAY